MCCQHQPSFAKLYTCHYSIEEQDGTVLDMAETLSTMRIAEYVRRSPNATVTLCFEGEAITLPLYALRRRNAVVAELPGAPPSAYRENAPHHV
ncbi:hypothetical protein BCR43DRAFT_494118 [Syncephalastrum racemosum]|uniref:Uncharacterized protein n=1 Tax=Syncephalastrum racemosum TaxID=13706 RepID=A0A1X2H7F1_SYNRA|nr:hypothetical protein BCR43DRAFT_494118 [Syncephalastrum racemosum]